MVAAVTRAAGIIDRVRSLYGRGTPEREVVDLNEILREMTVLLRDTADRHAVSMRTELDLGLLRTTADRVQLQQVLLNRLMNALEAMTGVTGRRRELTVTSGLAEDHALVVTIGDTGPGLDPGNAHKVFDAFFTTKPNGMGLGLAISTSIVEAHGGRLWASAVEPHGAAFSFSIPAAEDQP